MLFYFIRHGDPIYDPDSLTALGKRQAEAVGRRIALHGADRIFASSSNRARMTAAPCCEILKKNMEILDWCNESHAWRQLAMPTDDGGYTWAFSHPVYRNLFLRQDVRALGRAWYTHPAFEGTTLRDGILRIQRHADAFFAELGYEHDLENNCYRAVRPNDDRIALFAHQGFGLAFLSCVLDIPYPLFCTSFDMGHTGLTIIDFRETYGKVVPCVLTLSGDGHLYAENLPTKYQNLLYI